ncbi:DUF3052 family protein [Salisediminibacterium beveridgei]|uniref:DUF3052 domain-containing protein n=1 Tax=Salisediminibacterium beveridgei TaxID=632773 RepID=A0A1D7QY68_9BACI|nr:DUF3052 family protein [Salisediminibacterium beveridgei]AOM83955.1 hypothetical protein BBEV_2617 [Salisediminibacterium beveridgei]
MHALAKKMQLKEGKNILVINHPKDFEQTLSEWEIETMTDDEQLPDDQLVDAILIFVLTPEDIAKAALIVRKRLPKDGMLWVAYPKKSSKRYKATVDRDHGWEAMDELSLRPVRQVALDDDWSCLRWRPKPS